MSTPRDMTVFTPSSTDMSVWTRSASATICRKPVVGFGVVGTKTVLHAEPSSLVAVRIWYWKLSFPVNNPD